MKAVRPQSHPLKCRDGAKECQHPRRKRQRAKESEQDQEGMDQAETSP